MRQARAQTPDPACATPTGRAACPNCGDLVPRFHHTGDGRAAEVLACGDCGRFAYTTEGPEIPLVVPAH
jgi:ribosomal protein S27AE